MVPRERIKAFVPIGAGAFFVLRSTPSRGGRHLDSGARLLLHGPPVHGLELQNEGDNMGVWERLYAQRVASMKASAIREAFTLAERGEIISFAGGFPAADTFPTEEVGELAREVAATWGSAGLQYGPTEGFRALRLLVAERLAAEGLPCDPDHVLITTGSQQALDLIGKLLLNPGDEVIVEQPAYVGALNALGPFQPTFRGVPMDHGGMQVEALAAQLAAGRWRPKLCYLVPNFHNPTGVTLSEPRREQLMQLAQRYDFAIVEDNPYGALRFEGKAPRHIKAWDADGRVLYLGSFSKIFLPGLRIGYVVGCPEIIKKLAVAKQGADLCSNSFGQQLILAAERRGVLKRHLDAIVPVYKERRDLMLQALHRHFPSGVQWTRPQGGFFIWMTLPPGIDAKALLPKAVADFGVAYIPGGAFYTDGGGAGTLRLAYSQVARERLVEGIGRLAALIATSQTAAGLGGVE